MHELSSTVRLQILFLYWTQGLGVVRRVLKLPIGGKESNSSVGPSNDRPQKTGARFWGSLKKIEHPTGHSWFMAIPFGLQDLHQFKCVFTAVSDESRAWLKNCEVSTTGQENLQDSCTVKSLMERGKGLELVAVTGPQKPESSLGAGPSRGVHELGHRWIPESQRI